MPLRKQLLAALLEKRRSADFWIDCALLGLLALALGPVTLWFAETAHAQSRLFHALAVLAMAALLLVRFGDIEVARPLELNAAAKRALMAATAFLLIAYLVPLLGAPPALKLAILPAYCCALAGGLRFVFGGGTERVSRAVAATLCVFLFFSLIMEPLDWPLRRIAGASSQTLLDWLGQTTNLGLVNSTSGPPMLILLVNEHPFHVASECNGFGVILTSLLIAVLLGLHAPGGVFRLLGSLAIAVLFGLTFNLLRIVVIILLAPPLMEHYMLMHEIVGGVTYWGCLALLWITLGGPTGKPPSAPPDA